MLDVQKIFGILKKNRWDILVISTKEVLSHGKNILPF